MNIIKKFLIFPFLFLGLTTVAQKIALLSTDLKKPIIYTDSVTVQQVKEGYFPVSPNDFDTLFANLKYIQTILNKRDRLKMESFVLKCGNTRIEVGKEPMAYGDRYFAKAISRYGEVIANFNIVPKENKNKENSRWLDKVITYIFNNNSYFKGAYEITPKLYEVVVTTE